MLPTHRTTIVSDGLARLTSAYVTEPNVIAWLTAYLEQAQELEDATFAVLSARNLATQTLYDLPETNPNLDVLGSLVGQLRGGAGVSDADYQSLIYLRIAIDRSTGRITDWSSFGGIIKRAGADGLSYLDGSGYVYLGAWNMELAPNVVAGMLSQATGNGIGGTFAYSAWPDGDDFEFSDAHRMNTTGQGGFGDAVAGLVGGLLVSGVQL